MAQTEELASPAPRQDARAEPHLSVVVTVFDEAASLEELYARTIAALEPLGTAFELIFVDDGSTDASRSLLDPPPRQDVRLIVHRRI